MVDGTDQLVLLRRQAQAIRRRVVAMAAGKGEGYVGQGLQAADIMAVLFFRELRGLDIDPKEHPAQPEEPRDHFILSTGHYAIGLYAALAERGILESSALDDYGADGSLLEMSTTTATPGVEFSGGSLGQGLSFACGLSLGLERLNKPERVFTYMSDGELQEGSTWEAAMLAGHRRIERLVAIVDVNRVQADGSLVVEVEPVAEKWRAFGWWATTVDGNDVEALVAAFDLMNRLAPPAPRVLVCNTQIGFGVPMFAGRPQAHFVRVAEDEWEAIQMHLEVQ